MQLEENRQVYEYSCSTCSQPVGFLSSKFGEPYVEDIYCIRCGNQEKRNIERLNNGNIKVF